MYPQDVCIAKHFHIQSILLAQNLQPVPKKFRIMTVMSGLLRQNKHTFPWKFLSISIFADLISRWMWTGTVFSWMYSIPLAASNAIFTLVDHGNGSLPENQRYNMQSWTYINRNEMLNKQMHFHFHLSCADVDLSCHSRYTQKLGKRSPQRNILLSEPAWSLT